MRRFIVLCLLLAACSGGTVADGGPRPGFPDTGPASTSTSPSASTTTMRSGQVAVIPPEIQARLVVGDADLPGDLRHLVVVAPQLSEGPEPGFFSTAGWQWVLGSAETYRPWVHSFDLTSEIPGLRPDGISITSGTFILDTIGEAEELFVAGSEAARRNDRVVPRHDDVRVFGVEGIGDEAVALEIHDDLTDWGGHESWERHIVFRRHNVLGVVMVASDTEAGLPSVESTLALAEGLDAKVAAAIAEELEPATDTPVLASSPVLQLSSFEYRFDTTYGLARGDQTVSIVGYFEAPDRQECTIVVDGLALVTLRGDSRGLAVDEGTRYRFLDDRTQRQVETGCLGSNAYFDAAFDLFDEGLYIPFDLAGYEWDLETVNGVETRHYGIDDVPEEYLQEELGTIDQFDIWFHAADGWPVRLELGGIFSSQLLMDPSVITSQDQVPTTISLDIARPNDPAIQVDVPEDILPPGMGS